jgi:hypothetical protein
MGNVEQIANNYMLYFLVPGWIVPGLADYACHRRTRIETTSGLREAVLHFLMITVVGVPILLGLLLEINALVILLMIGAYFVHLAMALYDVSYAVTKRTVTPIEQHVHSFLEVLPFMAVSFVVCLYWGQAQALIGLGPDRADFSLRLKDPPLPGTYLATVIAAVLVFLGLPYAEEILRCYRASLRQPSAGDAVAESPDTANPARGGASSRG